jgi:hypothetical protein
LQFERQLLIRSMFFGDHRYVSPHTPHRAAHAMAAEGHSAFDEHDDPNERAALLKAVQELFEHDADGESMDMDAVRRELAAHSDATTLERFLRARKGVVG